MTDLSLRARLLLWTSAASAVTLALVIVVVDATFRASVRDQLETGLAFARQVAEDARARQIDVSISETSALALDAQLRAAAATGDPATIAQTLNEVFTGNPTGWAGVVALDGSVLAATEGAPLSELARAATLIEEARYYDTGDFWVVDGIAIEVSASGIPFGAMPLAVLINGRTLDSERLTSLETSVGRSVALVGPGRLVLGEGASRLSDGGRRALEAWGQDGSDDVEQIDLAGERFFAAALPILSRGGAPRGALVLLASYDEALQPGNRLRIALIAIFLLGLALAFGVSGALSRAITVPVGRLLRETERLGRGDLEHPIVPLRADEIGKLAESFDDMRISLRSARADLIRAERLSAIGKAASTVAHDFTQPLSAIAGAVGLLRMGDSSDQERDLCFDTIQGELDRLHRMKQEIVEFARGESSLDRAEVRIDSFLENTVSALRGQLAARGIELSLDHGYADDWLVDSYRLERVIENLVRNAAAAIPDTGRIAIRSACTGNALVLEVEDDGTGIPEDHLDEIFEPFVSFGKKEGTGLGLAIARSVMQQHSGTITVASSPAGTCFTLTIPRGSSA